MEGCASGAGGVPRAFGRDGMGGRCLGSIHRQGSPPKRARPDRAAAQDDGKSAQQAKSNRDDAAQQVSLLNTKIELREKLVRHHQATIRSLERSMRGTDTELRTLEGHVSALKDEYARMVQQAYRMKLGANPLLFIFAADDFSQAALRFRLVQSYTSVRKQQVEQIEETQIELAEVRVTLNEERAGVETALAEQQAERDALRADRGERTALVDQLQAEEKRLRRAQKAQRKNASA